jgi:hypothetical protein
MFGLFKREAPSRKAMRLEFETVTKQLRTADPLAQAAVGHSLNMAHSMFRQRYTVSTFQALPHTDQMAYIHSLSVIEEKLQVETSDPTAALGFGLFKMWVGAVVAKDEPLMEQIAAELAHFSRFGDFSAIERAP